MLMWTLERIGIGRPTLYAAAARQAARIGALEGRRGFEAQAQFQGALAIVSRMARCAAVDARRAQTLIEQLVALPIGDDGRYAGAVARWLRDESSAARDPARRDDRDARCSRRCRVRASGEGADARPVTGKGRRTGSISARPSAAGCSSVREKQEGVPLDVALDLAAAARALAAEKIDARRSRARSRRG